MTFRFFSLILLLITLIYYHEAYAKPDGPNIESNSQFLVISDIHFNPFIDCKPQTKPCPLIKKLSTADSDAWSGIFAEQHDSSIARYHSDTGYALLLSLQQQLKSQKPKFVLM